VGHPFDILFQKGVIENSVEREARLLCITGMRTGSVLVAMMRLVCCISFLFPFRVPCSVWWTSKF